MRNNDQPGSQGQMLVIGDVIVDTYLVGLQASNAPIAPSTAPLIRVKTVSQFAGGASFSASMGASLGIRTTLLGLIGDDSSGHWLRARLRELQVDDEMLVVPDRPTTVKTRIYHGATLVARADHEVTHPPSADIAEHFLATISAQSQASAILFQDYDKGALTRPIINAISQHARSRRLHLFADPKHRHFGDYRHCTLFKSNLAELNHYFRTSLSFGSTEFEQALRDFCRDQDHQYVLVTADVQGMALADRQSVRYFPAPTGPIIDTCGAGEAVLATAAASILNGANIAEAVAAGSVAAAEVCATLGLQLPRRNGPLRGAAKIACLHPAR